MNSISKSSYLSSSLKEEVMVSKKQGIVSILGTDNTNGPAKSAPSLRRTLSADMSSKKWQSQHGSFSPLKKIASSETFLITDSSSSTSSSSSSEEQERAEELEIWGSVQEEEEKESVCKKNDGENPGQMDIWSSILTQKERDESKDLPPPYVHPLVRRSTSSLSEKSLEICTESLGSETGSDVFSSYPPSETGDVAAEEDKEDDHVEKCHDMEDFQVVKYNLTASAKKQMPRSFPPPIHSLSSRDGTSVRMRSHRDNGRLVLEAVSVSSQNNFHAQRLDGRLVLTFINNLHEKEEAKNEEKNEMEQFEVELENCLGEKENGEDDEEEEEAEEEECGRGFGRSGGSGGEERFVVGRASKFSEGINVHRLALMMNHKPIALANRNPTWSKQVEFDEEVEEDEEELMKPITPLTQSLPQRSPVSRMILQPPAVAATMAAKPAASSFNAYEYYWKTKPMVTSVLSSIPQKTAPIRNNHNNNLNISKKMTANEQQDFVVFRGQKSCKEARRSLLIWEAYCIPTS